ncbi:MAG: pilus assembly protein [Candidatus Competibacteraceae bacterium]
MTSTLFSSRKISVGLLATMFAVLPLTGSTAPGTLASRPLFLSGTVKPNVTLVVDDSLSMDAEVLFYASNGYLIWNTDTQSFINDYGVVNNDSNGEEENASGKWKKYPYLFPNGSDSDQGRRAMTDDTGSRHYAVPPLRQYAFARSSDYNNAYYDPNTVYTSWPSTSSATYGDIDPANAPADPIHKTTTSDSFFDLTGTISNVNTDTNKVFMMYPGMVIPTGTRYHDDSWNTATSDMPVDVNANPLYPLPYGIEYRPATYYKKTTVGTYTIDGVGGVCSSPSLAHYTVFHSKPSSLSGVDALGPDGACLTKVELSAGTPEMQNFANWFSYYRKRHLGLRNAIGSAFKDTTGVRTGIIEISDLKATTTANTNLTDLDAGTNKDTFLSSIYNIDGAGTTNTAKTSGTPNRIGLNHAGKNYERTGTDAPIQYQCQKNFVLQFTDGLTTDVTFTGPGNADNAKGKPYEDSYSDTLADVAMKYYITNLRADLTTGKVPVPAQCSLADHDLTLDCNKNLHMNTLTMALSMKGTIFGTTLDGKPYYKVADAYANPPTWPSVSTQFNPAQLDDLYHAAINGRGEMFSADTPKQLADQMADALNAVTSSIGSAAAVTFNTSQLSANSSVYLALFNSSNWTGDLLSYTLRPEDGQVNNSAAWSAAAELDKKSPSSRIIYTYSSGGVLFTWDSLSDAQKNDLRTTPPSVPTAVDADVFAQAKLNFLRGDRSNEGKKGYKSFRTRSSVLGDIVHSAPVYVGSASTLNLPNDTVYQAHANTTKSRTGVLYIGANDGMLHGFRASDGEEVLAYIPSNLFSTATSTGLHYLADPAYSHRFYVDLEPVVYDAPLSGVWKSLLIGGERGGGRGYFALDVTDPTQFISTNANTIVKWEFTSNNDSDLGYTVNLPVVAKMENDQWAVIFGNGYEDTGGGSGTAKLFIAYLDGGLDGVWTINTDYIKIDTGIGSTTDRNGLASPALVDIDGNGKVDRAYAGDLKGNMWAFDLSSSSSSSWAVAYATAGVKKPLFTTRSNQPITTEPLIVKHPSVADTTGANSNKPNVLVLFGTGQYLVDGDKTSTSTQSVYGIWDDGAATAKPLVLLNLVAQTITTGNVDANGLFTENASGSVRWITDSDVNYTANNANKRYGWYLDLPASGERIVIGGSVRGKILFFNTMIPSSAACEYGGSGWLVAIDFANGGSPDTTAFDRNRDSTVDAKDKIKIPGNGNNTTDVAAVGEKIEGIPARSSFLSNYQYTPTSSTTQGDEIKIREVEGLDANIAGRLSWRELWNR